MSDKSTDGKSYIVQVSRTVSSCNSPALVNIGSGYFFEKLTEHLCLGAVFDKFTLNLNHFLVSKIVKLEKKNHVYKSNKQTLPTGVNSQKNTGLIPLRLTHTPDEYTEEQGRRWDKHERMIMRTLSIWDDISVEQKILIVTFSYGNDKLTMEKFQFVAAFCSLSLDEIIQCLFYIRGMYKQIDIKSVLDFDIKTHKCDSSVLGIVDLMNSEACPCIKHAFYMSRIYRDATENDNACVKMMNDVMRRNGTCFDPKFFLLMMDVIMLVINAGVYVLPYDILFKVDLPKRTRVCLILLDTYPKVLEKTKVKLAKLSDKSYVECTHEGLCDAIWRMVNMTTDTSSVNEHTLCISIEDDKMRIYDNSDAVLDARLDILHFAWMLTTKESEAELIYILKNAFDNLPKSKTIDYIVTWCVFEYLYVQNVRVFPSVSEKQMSSEENKQWTSMTYGITTEDDPQWIENDKKLEELTRVLRTYVDNMKKNTLEMLMLTEDEEQNNKSKKKKKQNKTKNSNGENLNVTQNRESKEDKEEQDVTHNQYYYRSVIYK